MTSKTKANSSAAHAANSGRHRTSNTNNAAYSHYDTGANAKAHYHLSDGKATGTTTKHNGKPSPTQPTEPSSLTPSTIGTKRLPRNTHSFRKQSATTTPPVSAKHWAHRRHPPALPWSPNTYASDAGNTEPSTTSKCAHVRNEQSTPLSSNTYA